MMFYPGQIVVCVDNEECEDELIVGWKYVVEEFIKDTLFMDPPELKSAVVLVGIPDWDFCAKMFRPLDDGDLALLAQKHKIKEKME